MGVSAAAIFGAEALGAEAAALGAEALGAEALGAGALGAESLGAGALGAEAIGEGAGMLGAIGAEGLTALELAAAAPELAAPAATGVMEAGALAPAAGSLAPSLGSPAISGLSTVAGEAIPGAIAEGAGVVPLTETAVETAAAAPGVAAPAADILATPLAPEAAAAPGVAAPTAEAVAAPTTVATAAPETGLSTLAQGAPTVVSDAAPIGAEGSQLAQATTTGTQAAGAPGAAVTPTATTPTAVGGTAAPAPAATTPSVGNIGYGTDFLSGNAPPLSPTATASPLAPAPEAGGAATGAGGAAAPSSSAVAADAAGQAGGEGLTGSVSKLAGKAGDYLAKNPTAILSALGMAANMMKGQQPPKYSADLARQAAELNARGAQLQGYLTSGTLPPGIGSALSGAHNSAAASIRSRYANMGMSGSSAEMQDLNNLAQTTVSQGADIANKLLATGVNQQQFASGLYQNLMATSMQQDTNMSNAIAGFTNAMAKASAVG